MVVFVTKEWHVIGHKGRSPYGDCRPLVGFGLEKTIARITRIPEQVLHNYEASYVLGVDDKLKWMDGRETTRPEDKSYALFGIVGVTLPAIYGEKYEGAKQRLLAAIHQQDSVAVQQAEHYRKIAGWLSPRDPWANHESARQRDEPQTAIEDIQTHCQNATNTGHAIFYFSFSDNHKQTYRNLLVSLVVQLGKKEPGRSMLRQAYEKAEQRRPGLDELQKTLSASVASYDEVFIHLDAIDECPEGATAVD
ncbi:hypothetical protein B0A55_13339 [Friedmanniomyces simplex]|uniref:Nephrocystin 3-like N-terminal domain-containing protein n=1 Tax=Friedmanniomyces simplex TaxID=329884 RepID=A0A4U0VZ84_9PEZI|nr:hypothetical protein B0A55_13339 [Friedmanniomyces simplex]